MSRASRRHSSDTIDHGAAQAGRRRTRTWVAALIVVAASGAGWYWFAWRTPSFVIARQAERNVLLVTIDTLRADALGSYGSGTATPVLDRLASRGARFDFAHAHAVVTLPSHTSILTGLYPYEHGVRDNAGYRLPAGTETMATRLKQLGFATGAFVGGFPLDQRFGLGAGFDEYDDRVGEVLSSGDFLLPERRADQVVAPAVDWISTQSSKWFAWVHVFDPHAPYIPPEEWMARYPSDPYSAEVAWTDFALGRLFETLSRQSRPTLVIVTADHGEGLGQHGELTHGLFAYESTLRVPLIIAEITPAGRATAGVSIPTAVRHVDLLPTVLDAVGQAPDDSLAGRSLRDVVRNAGGDDRPSYFESLTANIVRGWAPLRGVIVGSDKYIDLPIQELYGLGADPQEEQNLLPAESGRGEVLSNTLATFNVAPPGRPGQETAAARERLRALGYTGGGAAPVRDRYTEADDPKRLVDLENQLHLGTAAYHQGRFDDAEALFQDVIAKRPDTEDAYRYLSFVYWNAGRPADAIRVLEQALGRGLTSAEIRVKLAIYLSETGRAARAVALLEGATGEDAEALNALGMAYEGAGRPADAIGAFERVLELDPTSGLAHQNIGVIKLRANDLAGAEASLTRALEIDPALPGGYTTLGALMERTGRVAEAIEAWQRAVALDPREFDALYNLTFALAATGRMDEARQMGNRYIATAPPALFAADIAVIRRLIQG